MKYINIYEKKYINIQNKYIDIWKKKEVCRYLFKTSIYIISKRGSISIFMGSIFVRFGARYAERVLHENKSWMHANKSGSKDYRKQEKVDK